METYRYVEGRGVSASSCQWWLVGRWGEGRAVETACPAGPDLVEEISRKTRGEEDDGLYPWGRGHVVETARPGVLEVAQ